MITLLAIVFVLSILVFVHELGHFLAARSVGVRVERFYIGFNLFGLGIKRKIGHTEYGLGLFPLGGYVKMAGMLDESMDTAITGEPWEFQSKNALQKIWIMSAGVIANLVLAVFVFFLITVRSGIAELDSRAVVGSVVDDFPAKTAGLLEADIILGVDGILVDTWDEMTVIIRSRPDEPLAFDIERGGKALTLTVTPRSTETIIETDIVKVGMIGIGPRYDMRPAGFVEAVASGFQLTGRWFILTYKSLGMIVTGKASFRDVGGPIFIAQLAGESARMGFNSLLSLLAIISVNFAFINILPIPALDGGHITVAAIEGIMRRSLPVRVRLVYQQIGLLLLVTLMVAVIYNDIARIFRG